MSQGDDPEVELTDLIDDLRKLIDRWEQERPHDPCADLAAVVDSHDPDYFHCVHCEQFKHIDERHGGRDTDPGYWCDACSAGF